ncbi:hypothetical protein QCA50_016756 [Cerrena zonata]|uniref:Uncharacterized protein n=1 Tax=Cerrena zonata TaxID=2478898 RepID=A0AAW0FSG7_9APHY
MEQEREPTTVTVAPEQDVIFAAAKPPDQVQFDEGNVGRAPDPSRPIWFSNSDNPATSREALGVWFRSGTAYKIYGTQNTMARVKADLKTASDKSLPIGNATAAEGLVSTNKKTDKPFRAKAGFVVKTKDYKSPWQFFTAQGTSAIAKFKTIINGISDRTTLTKIRDALKIAVDLKLADPQGFINANDASPIQFIDIHFGNDTNVKQLLDIVNEKLNS